MKHKWVKLGMAALVLALGQGLAQKKEVTFWHIQTTGNGPKLMENAVKRFMADNPDVDVKIVPTVNDVYKVKLKTAVGAGDAPCVFATWGGGPLNEYIKSGQVLDLTPFLNKDNYKNRFVKASFSAITFDGKIWGVPVENTAVALVFYNKAIFAKYGLRPPGSYLELLSVAKTLKKNGIAAFSLANKSKWTGSMYYMYLVDRLGGPTVFNKAANRLPGGSFQDPVFIKAGEMVQEMVKAGAFVDGYNGLDYDSGQSRQLMYAGKAAMELIGTWNIPVVKAENPDFYKNNLDFFPFPSVIGGKGSATAVVGTVGDNFYHVSKSCKHPAEAFRMIQYLIDDTSVKERAADGRIPPVQGFKTDDPVLNKVIEIIGKATSVQLWYDQYLPPEMGEMHKDTMQGLFGLNMTPADVAKRLEDLAKQQK